MIRTNSNIIDRSHHSPSPTSPPHIEYIEDYSIEASAQLLDINYLDRHYKALFKGPTRLIQVRCSCCSSSIIIIALLLRVDRYMHCGGSRVVMISSNRYECLMSGCLAWSWSWLLYTVYEYIYTHYMNMHIEKICCCCWFLLYFVLSPCLSHSPY